MRNLHDQFSLNKKIINRMKKYITLLLRLVTSNNLVVNIFCPFLMQLQILSFVLHSDKKHNSLSFFFFFLVMLSPRRFILVVTILGILGHDLPCVMSSPHRILLDTDVDTDDFIALLYLLKLNKTEFDLVVSLSTLLRHYPHFGLFKFC